MGRPVSAAGRVRLIGAGALLLTAVGCGATGWGTPAWSALPLLALAVAVTEIAVVHLSAGRQRFTFSLTEGAIGAAYVYAPGAWTVVAVTVGLLIAQVVRRQERLKLEFNVCQFAAGTALGAAMAHSVGGGVAGAVSGMAVFWLANIILVSWAVSIVTAQRMWSLLLSSAPLAAVHSAGISSLGILGAWLTEQAPLGLVALVVPLMLLWLSYDEQTARAAEARLFAELARLQEQASGRGGGRARSRRPRCAHRTGTHRAARVRQPPRPSCHERRPADRRGRDCRRAVRRRACRRVIAGCDRAGRRPRARADGRHVRRQRRERGAACCHGLDHHRRSDHRADRLSAQCRNAVGWA